MIIAMDNRAALRSARPYLKRTPVKCFFDEHIKCCNSELEGHRLEIERMFARKGGGGGQW